MTQRPDLFGAAIPEVLAHDPKKRLVWLQDLGEKHLYDLRESPWEERSAAYRDTLDEVAKFHHTAAGDLEEAELDSLEPAFDEALYAWEQDYFFEHFLGRFSRRAPDSRTSVRSVKTGCTALTPSSVAFWRLVSMRSPFPTACTRVTSRPGSATAGNRALTRTRVRSRGPGSSSAA